jgi:excisionase family DNA binding protein
MVSNKDVMSDDRTNKAMTTAEAAKLLHLSVNTVRQWSDKGIVKAYRIGPRGDRRFITKDVVRLLDELHKNNGSISKTRLAFS